MKRMYVVNSGTDITGTCSLCNWQDCLQVPWQNSLEELNRQNECQTVDHVNNKTDIYAGQDICMMILNIVFLNYVYDILKFAFLSPELTVTCDMYPN